MNSKNNEKSYRIELKVIKIKSMTIQGLIQGLIQC